MQYAVRLRYAAAHTNYVSNLHALLISHWPLLSCPSFPDQSLIGFAYNSFHYKLQQRMSDYSRDTTNRLQLPVLCYCRRFRRISRDLCASISIAPDTPRAMIKCHFSRLSFSHFLSLSLLTKWRRIASLKQSENDVNSRMRYFVRPS